MITFNPLWETMRKKNISTYALEKKYGLNKSVINRLKHDSNVTLQTINMLCSILDCNIEDVVEYIKD